jgi:hypothetical protein
MAPTTGGFVRYSSRNVAATDRGKISDHTQSVPGFQPSNVRGKRPPTNLESGGSDDETIDQGKRRFGTCCGIQQGMLRNSAGRVAERIMPADRSGLIGYREDDVATLSGGTSLHLRSSGAGEATSPGKNRKHIVYGKISGEEKPLPPAAPSRKKSLANQFDHSIQSSPFMLCVLYAIGGCSC